MTTSRYTHYSTHITPYSVNTLQYILVMQCNYLSPAEASPSSLVGEFYVWRQKPRLQRVQEATSFPPKWPHTGTCLSVCLSVSFACLYVQLSVCLSRLAEWIVYQTQSCVSHYTSINPVWLSSKDWESMTLRSTTVSTGVFRLFCSHQEQAKVFTYPVKYLNIYQMEWHCNLNRHSWLFR